MIKYQFILLFIIIITGCSIRNTDNEWQYYNQLPPDKTAKVFAPDIIKHMAHSAPTFTADGKEIYWSTVSDSNETRKIYFVKYENKKWSEPEVVSFSGEYHDDQPFLTNDASKLFFSSKRPKISGGKEKIDIWFANRIDNNWSEPQLMQDSIGFWTPTLSENGNIYFMDLIPGYNGNRGIFRSKFKEGKYLQPEMLPVQINGKDSFDWTPFISKDESYLIFSSNYREDDFGNGDLYISFRNDDDSWSEAVNMGPKINTNKQERFPGVSPDGKYLFFTRWYSDPYYHDLYWIDAGIIDSLRTRVKN